MIPAPAGPIRGTARRNTRITCPSDAKRLASFAKTSNLKSITNVVSKHAKSITYAGWEHAKSFTFVGSKYAKRIFLKKPPTIANKSNMININYRLSLFFKFLKLLFVQILSIMSLLLSMQLVAIFRFRILFNDPVNIKSSSRREKNRL